MILNFLLFRRALLSTNSVYHSYLRDQAALFLFNRTSLHTKCTFADNFATFTVSTVIFILVPAILYDSGCKQNCIQSLAIKKIWNFSGGYEIQWLRDYIAQFCEVSSNGKIVETVSRFSATHQCFSFNWQLLGYIVNIFFYLQCYIFNKKWFSQCIGVGFDFCKVSIFQLSFLFIL